MILIIKNQQNYKDKIDELINLLHTKHVEVKMTIGTDKTIMGLVGDTAALDIDSLSAYEFVESVKRIQEPYKMANRKFHEEDTIINVNGLKIGGGNFQVIAGPCSVESEQQITDIAKCVKKNGAMLLRGGAYKPRTSPYAFQGLMTTGIEYLEKAKAETNMPIVSEVMSVESLHEFENVDIIQIGARNMQNFALLKEVGKLKKPILLKRGLANTIEELLMSAEYIMAAGNTQVILCERGIRTFETSTRNTLDLSAIPLLKSKTHLPIIVDPSHASGIASLVEPLSLAEIMAGADGLMIEVHNNPKLALCDGAQSLDFPAFEKLMVKVNKTREFYKTL